MVYKERWWGTKLMVNTHLLNSLSREQVNNVRVVESPLWRGPGNIHGFVLAGKSYRQEQVTVPTVSEVRLTTSIS